MKCNFCQKDIEKDKEVKIKRGLLTVNRSTGKRSFDTAFYHQECWQVIRQTKKRNQKWFWILVIITILFLSLWAFWMLFYQVGK